MFLKRFSVNFELIMIGNSKDYFYILFLTLLQFCSIILL